MHEPPSVSLLDCYVQPIVITLKNGFNFFRGSSMPNETICLFVLLGITGFMPDLITFWLIRLLGTRSGCFFNSSSLYLYLVAAEHLCWRFGLLVALYVKRVCVVFYCALRAPTKQIHSSLSTQALLDPVRTRYWVL